MSKVALFIKHKTQPGKRNQVREVWETFMRPRIDANPGHEAYFYCFEESDPDGICVYQQYVDKNASTDFLKTESYKAYLENVEPLLLGPPELTLVTPIWAKDRTC